MTDLILTWFGGNPGKLYRTKPGSTWKPWWLYLAFLPSLAALALAGSHVAAGFMTLPLMALNALCGGLASWGILRGVKNVVLHTIFALMLTAFFFSANLMVSEFTGCCSGGTYH
jgi:hypothetical protein